MDSTTPSSSPGRSRRRAFTLAEVIIAASIFVVMIGLVMTVVVAQARFGAGLGNYSDMNEYSRKAVTRFDRDMRMATSVSSMGTTDVTVTVIDSVANWNTNPPILGSSVSVRYFFWPADGGTQNKLYRQSPAGSPGSAPTAADQVLISGLGACRFSYFDTDNAHAPTTASVKKILLTGTLSRQITGGAAGLTNTDNLVSAMVVMRSKPGLRL